MSDIKGMCTSPMLLTSSSLEYSLLLAGIHNSLQMDSIGCCQQCRDQRTSGSLDHLPASHSSTWLMWLLDMQEQWCAMVRGLFTCAAAMTRAPAVKKLSTIGFDSRFVQTLAPRARRSRSMRPITSATCTIDIWIAHMVAYSTESLILLMQP